MQAVIGILRLKTVHHFRRVKQQLITCLLTEENIFTLQCPCTVWSNTAIIIQIHPGSLWQFKRDGVPANNADLTIDNFQSFKYKAALVGKTATHNDGKSSVKNAKKLVPLKYLSNFWRSLDAINRLQSPSSTKLGWRLYLV